MLTIDQLKQKWGENQATSPKPGQLDTDSFHKIVKSRVKKHTNIAMQYFWASFTLQIIVYALLSHVILRYWGDSEIVYMAAAGILLFIPFTVILMKKFKAIAITRPKSAASGEANDNTLHHYIAKRRNLLDSFYRFKKWYELILIPLASAIGVFITFKLYVPGGVQEHQSGAIIAFALTLASCAWAIQAEDKRNFREPIQHLDKILAEFRARGDEEQEQQ